MYQQPQDPQGQPPQQTYYPPQVPYQQPFYPPQQPPKKSKTGLIIGLVVLCLVVFACISTVAIISIAAKNSNVTKVGSSSDTSNSASNSTSSTTKHYAMGDKVNVDSTWQAQIVSVKSGSGQGDYSTSPKGGHTYIFVQIALKNVADTGQDYNATEIQFKDEQGNTVEESFGAGNTAPTGANKVSPGDTLKGTIAYEVPETQKHFTLEFSATYGGDPAIFDLHL